MRGELLCVDIRQVGHYRAAFGVNGCPVLKVAGAGPVVLAQDDRDPLVVCLPAVFVGDPVLPGRTENEVNVIVQVAALEDLPFVLVEPEAAACGAAVYVEVHPGVEIFSGAFQIIMYAGLMNPA